MFWISLLCAISTEIEAAYAVGRLPPIPSSAALVSRSENTNCKLQLFDGLATTVACVES